MLKKIVAIIAIFVCTAVAWAILGSTIFYRTYNAEAVKIDASRVAATLHIDYRQKGLLWFSTYKVDFDGAYTFQNPTAREEEFVFQLPFPAQQAVYDNVQLLLDDKPLAVMFSGSQGLDSWRYTFARENADGSRKEISQARDFHLLVKTDFSGFDFPDNSLSPTEKRQTANG